MTPIVAARAAEATVLVADSDVLERMVIAAYLRDCGYRVIEAADSDEAVAILKEEDVEVYVILADVAIGGSLNGFKLSAWVREHRKGLRIILVGTIDDSAEAAADLCEHGPLMAKPYDPQLVVDRIKRLLAERDRRTAPDQTEPEAGTRVFA